MGVACADTELPEESASSGYAPLDVLPADHQPDAPVKITLTQDWVIEDAREIGYQAILLDTLPFLEDAQRLYQRFGFREIPPFNVNPMALSIYMGLDL